MNFQVFHVNPGKKLKKKDVNNNLSHFMSVFPSVEHNVFTPKTLRSFPDLLVTQETLDP